MLQRFLSMIKCKKVDLGKSTMTSGNAYRVTISYNGNWCRFVFNDNYQNKANKEDFLYCLWLDASSFEECRDVYDFAHSFCYDRACTPMSEVRKIYRACEKQSERLHRLFNENEINLISQIE